MTDQTESDGLEIWRALEEALVALSVLEPIGSFPNDGVTAMQETFEIGEAIRRMRAGARVARRDWNGKGQWLALQVPDEHSKMGRPYVYISPVNGVLVPWLASQTDLLADDWFEFEA